MSTRMRYILGFKNFKNFRASKMKIFADGEDTSSDLAIDQLSQAKNCILFSPSLIKSWMELVISQKNQ